MEFKELNISTEIVKAVTDMGFVNPSPIQEKTIPPLLEGRDLIGQAQTGTGKTAAFSIPLIEKVEVNGLTQALILCPTRELCMQVSNEIKKLSKYKKDIKILSVYGGTQIVKQIKSLKKGVEIVVGTPGRLMDLMRRRVLKLSDLKIVVLDEADEMFDMGFRDDMKFILDATNMDRQTCFFSATMGKEIVEFSKIYQNNPISIKIKAEEVTVTRIEQYYIKLKEANKQEALTRLLEIHKPKLAIVFCNTKRKVDNLVESLSKKGYLVDGLHGDLKQSQRDQVMKKFRNTTIDILIATDVAARGLDVDNVDLVFNYDLPQLDEYYVHRIGRTARAGKSGISYSFVAGRDSERLRAIERYTKADIKETEIPSLAQIDRHSEISIIEDLTCKLENFTGSDKEKNILIRLMEKGYDPFTIAQVLLSEKLSQINSQNHEKIAGIDTKKEKNKGNKNQDKKKSSRRSQDSLVTLFINRGKIDNFDKNKIIKALNRLGKVPSNKIGQIRIQKTYTFVDVDKSVGNECIRALNNKKIAGKKVKIEEAKN
ncbi:DEAD/DEAH box helicase [uncultured Anaerococcus sp.]|uniref:DEAD/DEAH box helicase n=1 Tax=uncultured Anaerococcus sp. TaxID=293428 RepID=UPI0026349076|nr:DEAD/DEAH box helicase [uncultured Anaerococcus sp.]